MKTAFKVKTPTTQAGNTVVTTNGSGVGTITFPHAYPSAPVVVAWGGNGESLTSSHPTSTTTGFTFTAYSQAGAPIASTSVRVLWIAHPATV